MSPGQEKTLSLKRLPTGKWLSIQNNPLCSVETHDGIIVVTFVPAFYFILFLVYPMAYGSSQARGRIGAAAAGLHHSHSNTKPKPCLQPTPQPMAMLDP